MNNMFASIFGESPKTQQARAARESAFQDMLNTRKQAAVQQKTDSVKMARYNALGNLLTTMVQPIGWGLVGGFSGSATGGVQPYDQRQYLEAFNRAVKASDDLRNIGTAEGEYQFKLADEDYRRQLALEDEARKREQAREDLEYKAQQKIAEINQRFENDMAKINRQGEIRQQIAEFNAAHKITNRATGLSIDQREKLKLLGMYGDYAKNKESYGETPKQYADWLKDMGYTSTVDTGTPVVVNRDPKKDPASKPATPTKNITVPAAPAGSSSAVNFQLR